MDRLMQDLRYAFRQIRRSPGFSATAIVVLTLGIGVNSALFTGMTALTARAAPGIGDPDGVVRVMPRIGRKGRSQRLYASEMSYPDFLDYAARRDIFDELAAFADVSRSALEDRGVARGPRDDRDEGLFPDPAGADGHGFGLLPSRQRFRAPAIPMVVVSHHFWERELDRARTFSGRTMELGGVSFRIVGVAPERFNGEVVREAHDLWLPIGAYPLLFPDRATAFTKPDTAWLTGVARLRVGVSRSSVRRAGVFDRRPSGEQQAGRRRRGTGRSSRLSGRAGSMNNDTKEITGPALIGASRSSSSPSPAPTSRGSCSVGVVRRREIAVRLSLGARAGASSASSSPRVSCSR